MRTLVIGYGNPSRRDDGLALHVLDGLRARWGRPGPTPLGDNWEDLGAAQDSLFLQQLAPELAATLAEYDRVILIDAALPEAPEAVHCEEIVPGYRMAAVSHHMEPAALLALTGRLYGRTPVGVLVSVRGHDFDFGDELSPAAAAAVPAAVECVASLIGSRDLARALRPRHQG